jgi:lambda family phage portal protein
MKSPAAASTWLDRVSASLAPQWHLRRLRARLAADLLQRHYEGAAVGRRTQNWNRSAGDANAVLGPATLSRLREVARDMVRNNPYAVSAIDAIADDVVGWGIVAKPSPKDDRVRALWKAWAETTACDADGRSDLYGLQTLVMNAVAESGEVLVRRRMRRVEDGLPIPMQLQVLEADFLDTSKSGSTLNGGQIVQGVEFDPIGTRVAYWLYPTHPGASLTTGGTMFGPSRRVPASEVCHVYWSRRPGQVRGPSWLAPVILRMKEFDEYEDASLVKQKVAACLAAIATDVDGTSKPLGTADDTATPATDTLSPGAILNLEVGRSVEIVQPPTVNEYDAYSTVVLRAIAAGLGISYEALTGDYSKVNFSSARMSRLRYWGRVHSWRWKMLIPQFCDPVWGWAMETAQIAGLVETRPSAQWTPPPMPVIEPDREGLGVQRNIRTGIQTPSNAVRERGLDPDEHWNEYAEDLKKLDALGIVLDSDARQTSQAGLTQARPKGSVPPAPGVMDDENNAEDRIAALLSSLPASRVALLFRQLYEELGEGGGR